MRISSKKTVYQGHFLRMVEKTVVSNSGKKGIWESVERTNTEGRGAVIIVAVTKEGDLILEKNWRPPIESYVIQFPAGLMDVSGEAEIETARRELLEETGYMAGELIPVMSVPLTPAMASTHAMHYFAPGVEFKGRTADKENEEIEVVKVRLEHVADYLLNLPEGVELDLRVPGILWVMQKRGII